MDKLRELIKKTLKEMSSTGQGGATFTPGTGAQYPTKNPNSKGTKNMYHKMGFKNIPKHKPKSYDKVELWENEASDFQKERTDMFDQIEKELNDLSPLISNAKNSTIEYYNNNPGSYAIVRSTDLILDYIKDIKQLLKGEEE